MLAQGYAKTEILDEIGINRSTLWRWEQNDEFNREVDRLSLMYGLASRAERMRIIQKAAREFVKEDGKVDVSGFTLLDLLKEARMQTEGVRLDILSTITGIAQETPIAAETRPVADSGPDRRRSLPDPQPDETD